MHHAQRRAVVVAELVRICMKALAFDRNERYQTASELRNELEEFLSERSATVAAKRAAAFMSKHFGAECERMRQKVQKLLTEQRDEPAAPRAHAQPPRASLNPRAVNRSTGGNLFRSMTSKLDRVSPITTLLCGAVIATFVTWMLMSSNSSHSSAPVEQQAPISAGR